MGNKKNLKPPFTKDSPECSPEIASKNGRKGGKKSGETKRAKKALKDLFIQLSNTQLTKDNDLAKGRNFKIIKILYPQLTEEEITHQVLLYFGQFKTAIKGGKGSTQAFNSIRDTMGETPKGNNPVPSTINIIVNSEKQKVLMEKI